MRVALAIVCALATTVAADVELKNDSFAEGSQVAFQGGFVNGEIGAARFSAPDANRELLKVQLLFGGGSTATESVTLIVYDDTAGTTIPGAVLYRSDFQLMGSNSAIHEMTPDMMVTLPAQFRIGIQVVHDGAPSIAADTDGQTPGNKNFIFAIPGGWINSPSPGLGDWVIRAFVSGTGGDPMGGPCAANPDCPIGEFCDTAAGTCTFECRTDPDCGGGICNSLGQCVGGDDGGGGGCCQSSRDAELPALLFGAGVLGLLIRRRRCAR